MRFLRGAVDKARRIFETLAVTGVLDSFLLKILINEIIEDTNQDDFLRMLFALKRDAEKDYEDKEVYFHSLETCIYSVIVGRSLGYSKDELRKLATGALLHDIGKINIPKEVLFKPGQLDKDEFEIMKKHSFIGGEMLKSLGIWDEEVVNIALHHHEKLDGSGYPFGINAMQIGEMTRIVSVADIYDALTTNRVYRPKMREYEALDYIFSLAGYQVDLDITKTFSKSVNFYPLNSTVVLSTGEIARVIDFDEEYRIRPILSVIDTHRIRRHSHIIDLCKERTLFIEEIL